MGNIYRVFLQGTKSMSLFKFINFDVRGDDRGALVALEANKNVPFEIKRIYYLTKLSPHLPRGFHAHKALRQLAICLSGSCQMLFDDGFTKEIRELNSPAVGVLIEPEIWHEMHSFSEDCVFLVLASEYYDEADYLRTYDDFLKWRHT